MKVIITNQHCDNRGDESATIGLIETIYTVFGKDTWITMFKQTPQYRFITEDLGIHEQDMLIRPKYLMQLIFWIFFKFIKIDIRKILSLSLKKMFDIHEESDLVISSCGGPYIGDIYINHEIIHILYLIIPLMLKKKVVFAAPSMGPFNKKYINPFRKYLLKRASLIVLRDHVSYEYALNFLKRSDNIFLTADACFASEIKNKIDLNERKNIIGFTPLDFAYPKANNSIEAKENYKNTIVAILDSLMEQDKDLKIEFFPQLYNKHSDLPFIQEFITRMKYKERIIVFSDSKSGIEQQKEIGRMKLMIATRYHSAVFACKMLVPCLCIAYEHKAIGMMEAAGLGDCVLDIYNVSKQTIEEKLYYIMNHYNDIFIRMQTILPNLTNTAKRTIELVNEALIGNLPIKTIPEQFFDDIIQFPMLCKNCGMCAGICPTKAINMNKNVYHEYLPQYNPVACIGCNKCVNACCAREMGNSEKPFGHFEKIYIGKSNNPIEAKNGASGGVVTALLCYGLKKRYFSEVLTQGYVKSRTCASPVYLTDAENQNGSKYVAEPLLHKWDENRKDVAVTALPCQAEAVRKQNSGAFIFGLFCSKLSTEMLIEYMAKQKGIDLKDIKNVSFRSGTWPGNFILETSERVVKQRANKSNFTAAYNSYYFTNQGCLLCSDYSCEAADISFGDPWGRKQYVEEYTGQTVIIVRSQKGKKLIDQAIEDGIIDVESYSYEELLKGHLKEIYHKKTSIKTRAEFVNRLTNGKMHISEEKMINGKIDQAYHRFLINNSWKTKQKKRMRMVMKMPAKLLFAYRYIYAYRLGKFLKREQYFKKYNGGIK